MRVSHVVRLGQRVSSASRIFFKIAGLFRSACVYRTWSDWARGLDRLYASYFKIAGLLRSAFVYITWSAWAVGFASALRVFFKIAG